MTGLVLAGGAGRRIGGLKPLLQLAGRPLAAYPAAVLKTLCRRLFLVGGEPSTAELLGLDWLPDAAPGLGPLGGLLAGLQAASDQALCLACDMPLMQSEVLARLCELAMGWQAVVPRVEGRLQPLAALYSRECLPLLEERASRGQLSLKGAVGELRALVVEEGLDPLCFTNVNTPSDLVVVERLLARSS